MVAFYPDRRAIKRFQFALVDASHREALPERWTPTVVAPVFLGDDTDRCPALVELTAVPDAECTDWCGALHHEVLALQDTRASLLLAADASAKRVTTHLAQRMVIHVPGQDRPRQWRYFDPGTFLQLPRILGDDGMAWLLGPIQSVQVPWAGEWTEVIRPEPRSARPFQLTVEHLDAIMRIGVVNRAAIQRPPPVSAKAWIRQTAEIDALVVKGLTRHDLTLRDDLVAFAHDAWVHHLRIDEHPRMQNMFDQLRQAQPEDELDYRELRSRLKPQDWAAMVAELQRDTQERKSP
jgi:hypothetical protein